MVTLPQDWDKVKALFAEALELNPNARSEFLRDNCPDSTLRAEVKRLLSEHDKAGSFLSTAAMGHLEEENDIRITSPRLTPNELLAGRFRIVRFIASGGMGEVYEAKDEELQEQVAVKVIRREILAQPDTLGRFKREVHLARKVTHPNICRIFDLFRHRPSTSEEIVFISMELLHGMTLEERLKKDGPLNVTEAIPVVAQMASALSAAHAIGIIHRDFKPGNVVLEGMAGKWRAVITDFGLALRSLPSETCTVSTGQGLLGTPAYMSPEQLEGRPATKLSDIYALGLVIYEMVSGVKPFQGDTPILAALKRLTDPPPSPQKFQKELTAVWESVILRCLERDPILRFESADLIPKALTAEVPLQTLQSVATKRLRRWLRTASVFLAVAAVILGYYWYKQGERLKTNLQLRQFTASSADNFIEYAVISPDGKYLAYLEKAGALFLSVIDTGETRVLEPVSGDVFPLSWFPDGTQLLATRWNDSGLWKASVLTGKLSKLRDNVADAVVSPDGKHILYVDAAAHEFWIMGPNGEGAYRVMVVEPGDRLLDFSWAPTGRRFAYAISKRRTDGNTDTLIESRDIQGTQPTVILTTTQLIDDPGRGLCWLPDGRLIYSLTEAPPNQRDSNLWAVNIDPSTGHLRRAPERLTNWAGFRTTDISATADGKRLSFVKSRSQTSIYIAPVAAGEKSSIGKVRRLTTDTWATAVDGWSIDSSAVYLSSNQSGRFRIYRQDLNEQVSAPLISGPEDYYDAHLSADGTFLLYTADPKRGSSEVGSLMSLPVGGGTPSMIATGDYDHQCALPPSNACVLSEKQGVRVNFYSLNPTRGRTAEPFKSIERVQSWSLSPDGKNIALIEYQEPTQSQIPVSRLQILSLGTGTLRTLELAKWTQSQLQDISWFANGKDLFVTAFLPSGTALLSVGQEGNAKILFQQGRNWLCCPKPAPNGRLLAFSVVEIQRDVALIENF